MPPALVKAHQALDKAVDKCYRAQAFADDAKRVEYLFGLYGEYAGGNNAIMKQDHAIEF